MASESLRSRLRGPDDDDSRSLPRRGRDWHRRRSCIGEARGDADEDADEDGTPACEDCDDTNAAIYFGAPGTGDNVDNNCDGEVDEGVKTNCRRCDWCIEEKKDVDLKQEIVRILRDHGTITISNLLKHVALFTEKELLQELRQMIDREEIEKTEDNICLKKT